MLSPNSTQALVNGNGDASQSLVVVFLRGGADGLSLVPPLEDDDYYRNRPRLAVGPSAAVPLDGFFGLNPLMKDWEPMYREGHLAIVPCAGSEDDTRSHFEAQDLMEHGGVVAGGWLGRFLRLRSPEQTSALSAVALGKEFPECLRGAPAVSVVQSLDEFSLGAESSQLLRQLERLYADHGGALGRAGRDTLDALRRIEKLNAEVYRPESGADYGDDTFSHGLKQIARLIKAQVGLEAASLDLGGWDSHFAQETLIDPLMRQLAQGLAAFDRDLGRCMANTTVVVMTEFGRRVRENASFGTDHGRGGVMFVLGGGVKGGRVYGSWPGLKKDLLEGPGDVPVRVNYRNVLAPVLGRLGAGQQMDRIFPGFELEPVSLYG